MTGALDLRSPDTIQRRMLMALELIDPVTGRPAGGALRVLAPGFAPPTVTRAGQIVWSDPEPPGPRTMQIVVEGDRQQFARYPAGDLPLTVTIPPRVPGAAPVIHSAKLVPTGLYEAPPGRLSVSGMVIDTAAARAPVVGAKVRVWLQSRNDAAALDSNYEGLTDDRGGFIAFVGDLGSDAPMALAPPAPPHPPAPDGSVVGWLAITVAGTTRHTPLLPLRQGRLYRPRAPFIWATLGANPPAFPNH